MAAGDRYYYLASLQTPGDLGSVLPMTPAQLLASLESSRELLPLVQALFLLDDLVQREAFLAGEVGDVEPAVLSVAQARNEAPMPSCLTSPAQDETGSRSSRSIPVDDLWEAYFRHAFSVARRLDCPFLAAWVGYEVALRNHLAALRARKLGLEPADYLVASDLADENADFSSLAGEWNAASTPLDAHKTLIRARWAWVLENQAWFSFSNDELAVYAVQIMMLGQWRRISASTEQAEAAAMAS
ncbi:MAG TPA: DUF2764 family protein [Phycisphaerae bacterium]|nr:DUF2764 family protein [Phycisphaerae bacterium]